MRQNCNFLHFLNIKFIALSCFYVCFFVFLKAAVVFGSSCVFHTASVFLSLFRPPREVEEEEEWPEALRLHRRLGGVQGQTRGQESGGLAPQHAHGHQETPEILF